MTMFLCKGQLNKVEVLYLGRSNQQIICRLKTKYLYKAGLVAEKILHVYVFSFSNIFSGTA